MNQDMFGALGETSAQPREGVFECLSAISSKIKVFPFWELYARLALK